VGDYSFVRGAAESLLERIAAASRRSGRDGSAVELLAVTKFHPLAAVEAAWEAGIRGFGESRVQEAERKYPEFLASHPGARLDMIGRLQSNKAKKAIALFSRVQSVDSEQLLAELLERARAAGAKREILLEMHTGEESKAGFRGEEELYRALEWLLEAEGRSEGGYSAPGGRALEPRGLMTMAPLTGDEAAIRASFRALVRAQEGARTRFGLSGFDELSMGMSGDFEIAVEEGSTLVRIGTALFGERPA
jgi:pyridoxal phosphate enzyme (YggS family)